MLKFYTFITYYCLNYPAVQSVALYPIGQTSRKLKIRIVLLTFEVIVGQTKRWAYEKNIFDVIFFIWYKLLLCTWNTFLKSRFI